MNGRGGILLNKLMVGFMKGVLVHGTIGKEAFMSIKKTGEITRYGKDEMKALGKQTPRFQDVPLAFCSYFCPGYEKVFRGIGIVFKTNSSVLYASPVDTWEFMREGNFIPGYERFLFSSVEEMLRKYPTCLRFKKDFVEFFRSLDPEDVYPHKSKSDAEKIHVSDYTNDSRWHHEDYNEVAFKAPLNARIIAEFNSTEELKQLLRESSFNG